MEPASKKWSLDQIDIKKWINNSFVFIAPVVLIYFSSVIVNINNDGFDWKDFKISKIIVGAMVLYILNVMTDFFRKLTKNNTLGVSGQENKPVD